MPNSQTRLSRVIGGVRRHPWVAGLLCVLVIGLIGVVLVWFQPQTLFFDRVVDEELPVGLGASPDEMADDDIAEEEMADEEMDDEAAEGSMAPMALASGSFESRSRYTVGGTAIVFRLEDGSRVLRLEDFSSTNGPDLYVYLTSADAAESDAALDADFVDLGLLTGNIGNQNYLIGDNVDLDRYDTVVIWCRRFTVGFGAADLIPPG